MRGGETQDAEGDTKSAGQGQPEKLINFSLTLCRAGRANNIEAIKHQVMFFGFFLILRSSFQNKYTQACNNCVQ